MATVESLSFRPGGGGASNPFAAFARGAGSGLSAKKVRVRRRGMRGAHPTGCRGGPAPHRVSSAACARSKESWGRTKQQQLFDAPRSSLSPLFFFLSLEARGEPEPRLRAARDRCVACASPDRARLPGSEGERGQTAHTRSLSPSFSLPPLTNAAVSPPRLHLLPAQQPISLSSIEAPPAPPKKPASAIQRYSKEFLLKFIGVSFFSAAGVGAIDAPSSFSFPPTIPLDRSLTTTTLSVNTRR
jgi:hypothetical protein